MKESHDRELGGGCGRQRREDIEKETVLTDGLGAEDVSCGQATGHCLWTTRRICGTLKNARPWKRWPNRVEKGIIKSNFKYALFTMVK